MGIGKLTAWYFGSARDVLARMLLMLHITPNMITCFGTMLTMAAGGFLAAGVHACGGVSSNFPWWSQGHRYFSTAAGLLFCSATCDMSDGAMEKYL